MLSNSEQRALYINPSILPADNSNGWDVVVSIICYGKFSTSKQLQAARLPNREHAAACTDGSQGLFRFPCVRAATG